MGVGYTTVQETMALYDGSHGAAGEALYDGAAAEALYDGVYPVV